MEKELGHTGLTELQFLWGGILFCRSYGTFYTNVARFRAILFCFILHPIVTALQRSDRQM
jgi:hypothetical protein